MEIILHFTNDMPEAQNERKDHTINYWQNPNAKKKTHKNIVKWRARRDFYVIFNKISFEFQRTQ